ncbi:MAG: hypothetical protein WBD20_15215 [Pirellulaceae bacterium]
MWRAIFIALGIMAIIFGTECLMIDSAVLYSSEGTKAVDFFDPTGIPNNSSSEWRPKEWLPWAVASAGWITVLYAFTLPRRWRNATAEG